MFVVSYVSNLSYVRERESKVVILVTIAGLWVHHGPYCSSRKVQQGWGGAGRGRGATRGGAGTEQLSWVSRVVSVVVSSLTWRRVPGHVTGSSMRLKTRHLNILPKVGKNCCKN